MGLASDQGSGREWSEQVLSMVNFGEVFDQVGIRAGVQLRSQVGIRVRSQVKGQTWDRVDDDLLGDRFIDQIQDTVLRYYKW